MIFNLIVILFNLFIGFHFLQIYKGEADSYKIRKKYIIICSVVLILQSGLRNVAVGADTYTYLMNYESVSHFPWSRVISDFKEYYEYGIGKDPGFDVLQKMQQTIIDDYQFFLFSVAVLFFIVFGNFLLKNSKRFIDVILGFLVYSVLFYSFYSLTGIRQTIATAITLYSYEFVKKKKIIPFILLVLIASTIHKSSVFFFIFYFLCRIKNTKYLFNLTLFMFPVFFQFKDKMASYLMIISGYDKYEVMDGGAITFTVFFLIIGITGLLRRKVILSNDSNASNYYNAFSIVLIFLPITWVNPTFMRINMYFTIFLTLFIPEILYSFKDISLKLKNDITILAIIVLMGLYIKGSWITDQEMPYGFCWEEMRLPKHYYIRDDY